jgi:hypothetical protein
MIVSSLPSSHAGIIFILIRTWVMAGGPGLVALLASIWLMSCQHHEYGCDQIVCADIVGTHDESGLDMM